MKKATILAAFLLTAVQVLAQAPATPPKPGKLTRQEKAILKWVDSHVEEAITFLGTTVDVPSSTLNIEGVRRVGAMFDERFRAMGFETRWAEMPPELRRAGHLIAEHKGRKGKRVLLIGHLDTVLEGGPWRREGSIGHGIGSSDMKGGDVILLYALAALHKTGALDNRRIIVVLTGDEEESGRPFEISRRDLVEAAKQSDVALAFEGTVTGTGTIARRGISSWRLTTRGRTGHSSSIFGSASGNGAIFEAARIIDAFRKEIAGEAYLTFNPSVIVGGTDVTYDHGTKSGTAQGMTNVIPQLLVVEGDLRYVSREQLDKTRERMRAIVSQSLPGASAEISFEDGYPAMAPKPGNYEVLRMLSQASVDLGKGPLEALDPSKRGAGDVAFVSDIIPCLDGLGSEGQREHAPEEFIELDGFGDQIRLAALMIYRLTRQE